MKILLLTDGSSLSLEAARWLAANAGNFATPGEAHLLYVQPPVPYPGAAAAAGRKAADSFYRETSEAALEPAARILQQAGVPFRKSWTLGEVVPTIAEYARAGSFELVVMATHGHGAFTAFALGSVSAKCMALLGIPILLVPRPH
jgi:nucleotide-binding universal stress UspA family protein